MVLTSDSEVPYHIITPFEQVSHLKALVLSANNGGHILVREVVQSAGISKWFEQTRTGLRIATKELAVKLLLTRGQIHRRHDVGLRSKAPGSVVEEVQESTSRSWYECWKIFGRSR